jgi:SAM-dependent methyltransferase
VNDLTLNQPDQRCPLCQGRELRYLQPISADTIVELYGSALADAVRSELSQTKILSFVICQSCDLRFFSPTSAATARLYEALQKFDFYYQLEKPEFDYARSLIGSEADVLEVGCGAGAFGSSLKCGSYLGLELTSASAERARALGLAILERTIEDHALQHSASYDVVCAFQVLEHIAEPGRFISGCLATLRPGGRLILSIPSADSFAGSLPNHALDLPPHHMTRWSDRCLLGLNSVFPASIEEIWHETLRPVHYRMFLQSRFYSAYSRLARRKLLPVDMSTIGRFVLSLGWKLSRILLFAIKAPHQRGISVTVVLRKPT